jgi:hypothetical protein
MLGLNLLHLTFWAFSVFLGSLGVFFVYSSFLLPHTGADAIICLAAATALALARPVGPS